MSRWLLFRRTGWKCELYLIQDPAHAFGLTTIIVLLLRHNIVISTRRYPGANKVALNTFKRFANKKHSLRDIPTELLCLMPPYEGNNSFPSDFISKQSIFFHSALKQMVSSPRWRIRKKIRSKGLTVTVGIGVKIIQSRRDKHRCGSVYIHHGRFKHKSMVTCWIRLLKEAGFF